MDKNVKRMLLASIISAAVLPALAAMAYFIDWYLPLDLRQFGVRPMEFGGLAGIVFYPLLHGNLDHLASNLPPVFVLGWLLRSHYVNLLPKVVFWVWLMSGAWLWVAGGQGSNHIGMSGLVYGLGSFLFFAGLLRRNYASMALSLIVVFAYGYMVWGALPLVPHVSWQGHLFGLMAGAVLAVAFRNEGPEAKKYSWELEPEEGEGPE